MKQILTEADLNRSGVYTCEKCQRTHCPKEDGPHKCQPSIVGKLILFYLVAGAIIAWLMHN
jgi:hypothetical protein